MIDFRTLNVWSKSHQLNLEISKLAKQFPISERYTLTPQIRRTAMNIPINIANSCGSDMDQEALRSIHHAARLCSELEYMLILVVDFGYSSNEECQRLTQEVQAVRKMIFGYLKSIKGM